MRQDTYPHPPPFSDLQPKLHSYHEQPDPIFLAIRWRVVTYLIHAYGEYIRLGPLMLLMMHPSFFFSLFFLCYCFSLWNPFIYFFQLASIRALPTPQRALPTPQRALFHKFIIIETFTLGSVPGVHCGCKSNATSSSSPCIECLLNLVEEREARRHHQNNLPGYPARTLSELLFSLKWRTFAGWCVLWQEATLPCLG